MPGSQISDFQFAEVIRAATVPARQQDLIVLQIPLGLLERRIFLYLEVKQSSIANYLLDCEIALLKGSSIRGRYPAKIADIASSATVNQSVASILNAGGSPVGDSLVLRLAQPFDLAVPSVVIQPLRVNGEADRCAFGITNAEGATLTGFRAFLAVLSTKY